jgi:hypothetical protein
MGDFSKLPVLPILKFFSQIESAFKKAFCVMESGSWIVLSIKFILGCIFSSHGV